jgi:hypothetical protein
MAQGAVAFFGFPHPRSRGTLDRAGGGYHSETPLVITQIHKDTATPAVYTCRAVTLNMERDTWQ